MRLVRVGFISLCIAEIINSTGTNYARMTEFINEYNRAYYSGWDLNSLDGIAKVAKEINKQAALIGYLNAFGLYTLASARGHTALLFVVNAPTKCLGADGLNHQLNSQAINNSSRWMHLRKRYAWRATIINRLRSDFLKSSTCSSIGSSPRKATL